MLQRQLGTAANGEFQGLGTHIWIAVAISTHPGSEANQGPLGCPQILHGSLLAGRYGGQ
ncbi:hypothetical protein D3C80_2197940 [compost metagenome]